MAKAKRAVKAPTVVVFTIKKVPQAKTQNYNFGFKQFIHTSLAAIMAFSSLGILPPIGGHFLRVTNRRDKYARSLGARDDENLSRAISWLTDLMQMERQRRVRRAINADVRDEVVAVQRRF